MAISNNRYTINQIVERYTNAISDLAEVQKAINVNDDSAKEKSLSDAGEALSQTIEWALHHHILQEDRSYFSSNYRPSTPDMIIDNYLDGTTYGRLFSQTITTDSPTVDFAFLRDQKGPVTNNKKHSAMRLDFETQKQYAQEVAKFINEYIDDQIQLVKIEDILSPEQDQQLSFYSACNTFSHQDCLYLLLLDNRPIASSNFSHLNRVKWDLVIDMYMGSLDNGFVKNSLITNGIPNRIISINDRLSEDTFPLYNGEIPVIMANGLTGKSIQYNKAREWSRNYETKLTAFLEAFFNTHTEQKVVVVSLVQDAEFVRHLFNCIDKYARGLSFIITNDIHKQMESFPDQIADCIVWLGLKPAEVNQSIGRFLPNNSSTKVATSFQIPAKDGVYSISSAEMRSYQENMEILFDGIDDGYDESEQEYLNGSSILTWEGAHRKFAVTRTTYHQQYVAKIEKSLTRGEKKAMLIHEPGFGGTTIARQIAYDLHTKYPTIILKQYKVNSLKTQLERIYDSTSKSVLVIAEIPQALTIDDFEHLQRQLSPTRPILLLGVKRGTPSGDKSILELAVPDWGNDICLLTDKFKPYLKRYTSAIESKKIQELNQIVNGPSESYQRTPFYIGLLTFEEEFYAMDSYLMKFVRAISGNEGQRKVLIYLAMCDYYGIKKSIPEGFFATVFDETDDKGRFHLEDRFNKADGVIKSLLSYERNNAARQWQIRNPFFSKKLLSMLLNGTEKNNNSKLMNLGAYCKSLITDIANSRYHDILEDSILQQLLIGTKADRNGEKFTKIVRDMDTAEQEDVLNTLHVQFPNNAHFCSHLARYYSSSKKDFEKALELADLALSLSPDDDAMLYHIKATCFSHEINDIIDDYRNQQIKNRQKEAENLQYIIEDLLPQASENFAKARQYQHDDEKEITYLPNIYMLIKLFDYAVDVCDLEKKKVLGEAVCPYCEWVDEAQSILDTLKLSYLNEETEEYTQCETRLWESIKDFSDVIGLLNSQLAKGKNKSLIRRLIVRAYFKKSDKYKTEKNVNTRMLALMEDNIISNPQDESNYNLWFNAARYSDMSLETVLSKLNQWKGLNPTKDIVFYCYVFYAVKALRSDTMAVVNANNLLEQCKRYNNFDSIHIKEWYVSSQLGIKKYRELSTTQEERKRVYGRVSLYKHAGDARINLDCGLEVFFKPAASGITAANLNHRVSCLIGFSYDGIRAFDESVKLEDE